VVQRRSYLFPFRSYSNVRDMSATCPRHVRGSLVNRLGKVWSLWAAIFGTFYPDDIDTCPHPLGVGAYYYMSCTCVYVWGWCILFAACAACCAARHCAGWRVSVCQTESFRRWLALLPLARVAVVLTPHTRLCHLVRTSAYSRYLHPSHIMHPLSS